MSAVKAAPIDPVTLAKRFEEIGRAAGFRVEPFGEIERCPLFALTKRSRGVRPRIYLSAGIHGDEPAPPLALAEMMTRGVFDARANWFICPLLNPSGLVRNTRENAAGVDLNRDYQDLRTEETRAHVRWLQGQPRFDLTLCLHEDWEAVGFYLYELNPDNRPSLAQAILNAVAPICAIDQNAQIDGREARAGLIRPVSDPLERKNWPEAIYLRAHHTTLSYTLETASAMSLDVRIAAMSAAVTAAIGELVPPGSAGVSRASG